MKQPFFYERDVQYYETDQMQIVHHSNYIRWFEEARLVYMKQLGIDYCTMEEEGIKIPVLSAAATYRIAFHYGDTFRVLLKIIRFNGIKMDISYEVYNKKTGALHTTGETSHCFLNRDMRPLSIKKEKPKLYECLRDAVEKTSEMG